MPAEIIKSTGTVAAIQQGIEADIQELGRPPRLCIIRVGDKPDDIYYQNSVIKKCEKAGIALQVEEFPADIPPGDFGIAFDAINQDETIDGILMLRPLPAQLDEQAVRERIAPGKDIDCMSPLSLAKVFEGQDDGFAPCTAEAVVRLLEHEQIEIKGKEVVIIGRSTVVGKPLAMMLLARHATVTICHTRTADIQAVCRRADILVCAAGQAKMVTADYVRPGAVVIDVGINVDENGKMCGDVDAASVEAVASKLTPVPGGIGGVTSWLLLEHVVRAAK